MPVYDYVCGSCGHRFEVIRGLNEAGPHQCPLCGGPVTRAFAPPTILFKGSGWARMDRRQSGASRKKAPAGEATGPGSGERVAGEPRRADSGSGGEAGSTPGGDSAASGGEGGPGSGSGADGGSRAVDGGSGDGGAPRSGSGGSRRAAAPRTSGTQD